jgi:hypothetical protein
MSKTIGPKVRKSSIGGCGGHAVEEETALLEGVAFQIRGNIEVIEEKLIHSLYQIFSK